MQKKRFYSFSSKSLADNFSSLIPLKKTADDRANPPGRHRTANTDKNTII